MTITMIKNDNKHALQNMKFQIADDELKMEKKMIRNQFFIYISVPN